MRQIERAREREEEGRVMEKGRRKKNDEGRIEA